MYITLYYIYYNQEACGNKSFSLIKVINIVVAQGLSNWWSNINSFIVYIRQHNKCTSYRVPETTVRSRTG